MVGGIVRFSFSGPRTPCAAGSVGRSNSRVTPGLAAGTWDAGAPPSSNTEVALFIELRVGLLVEASVGAHRYDYMPIGKFD